MKKIWRLVASFLLLFGLAASYIPTLAGEGSGDPVDPRPLEERIQRAETSEGAAAPAVANAALSLGKPGLSYSYLTSYGTKDSFYQEDASHINHPAGVFATADGVWVVEEYGMRALKYSPTGEYVTQVGAAGHRYVDTTTEGRISIDYLEDAAVDSSGNLWLVNGSPSNILQFSSTGELLNIFFSEYNGGSGPYQFNGPIGIAFDPAGHWYVSDRWNNRVQVYNADGTYLATIGETEVPGMDDTHFNSPMRLAVDSNSRLYVADQENQRVQILDVTDPAAPVYVDTLGIPGEIGDDNEHFCYPQGVDVDATKIYVADTCNQRVQIFDRETRSYVATLGVLGEFGPGNDQFFEPLDVSVAPDGAIYIADYFNQRVQVFNSSRQYARTLGTTGVPYLTDKLHFNRPAGVAVDAANNMYVLEDFGQRLIKYGPTGSPIWEKGEAGVGRPEWRKDTAHLSNARDVAISPTNGNIYVSNTGNSDIRIYNPSGVYLSTFGTGEGQGDTEFSWQSGIFIAADGKLYVADSGNRRVQIFNADGSHFDTLGVTGDCSSEEGKFCSPDDVAVDSKGNIYVAESSNQRVQVFNSSRQYVRTLGVLWEARDEYGYFAGPTYLAVDRADNLYVSSSWNHVIHIYDSQGGFLGALGAGGDLDSQLANVSGLAFGSDGSLYAADYDHARVARYSKGYPNWQQKNITGFGDRWNREAYPIAAYKDHLYVGSSVSDQARLQMMDKNGVWTTDSAGDWGTPYSGFNSLYVYDNQLYAAAWVTNGTACTGLTLKRFNGTVWTDIITGGFDGKPNSCQLTNMLAFNNHLYALVWMTTDPDTGLPVPGQLWRSPSGDAGTWTKVADLSMITPMVAPQALYAYNNALYLATFDYNDDSGRVWRSTDGVTWSPATDNNLGNSLVGYAPVALTAYNGYLYAGVRNYEGSGAQLWRCQNCEAQSGWQKVIDNGLDGVDSNGDTFIDNYRIESFVELDGYLYAAVANTITGMQVWRSADGLNWHTVAANGFGVSSSLAAYEGSGAVFNDQVYYSATNYDLGGQIWAYNKFVYLPIVRR